MNTTKLTTYAPAVLRIGISLIIIWFGSQQLMHVSTWIGYLPDWTTSLPVSQTDLVYLNGLFEIVFGAFMLAGFYTRVAALLLALHMFDIAYIVGYDPAAIGMRDLGLSIAVLSVFMYGPDRLSLDNLWRNKNGL